MDSEKIWLLSCTLVIVVIHGGILLFLTGLVNVPELIAAVVTLVCLIAGVLWSVMVLTNEHRNQSRID